MSVKLERLINRAILNDLNTLRGIPRTQEDLLHVISLRAGHASMRIDQAIEYLESAGYIENATKIVDEDPGWVITATGTRQILRQVVAAELDPMIWEN